MSEAIDLQDVMLAELREFGTALAACIVVTAVVDHPGHITRSEHSMCGRDAASPAASGATARAESNIRPEFDWHAGLLLAARNAVAEARSINGPRLEDLADVAGMAPVTDVTWTLTGVSDWECRAQLANAELTGDGERDVAASISDDLLKMLGGCYFAKGSAPR